MYTANGKRKGKMNESLHCDCNVNNDTRNEHEFDCLVGSIYAVARALKLLGNADASTSMGAFEAFGAVVQEGFLNLTSVIENIGNNRE
jgi:hypothetical protein|tara:strand:- start:295 stop:558 length:264 start_codon:yes stop_codon:yes gene_type:complete